MVITGRPSISSSCARARIRSTRLDSTRMVTPCSSQRLTTSRMSPWCASSGRLTKTSSMGRVSRRRITCSSAAASSCGSHVEDRLDGVAEVAALGEPRGEVEAALVVPDDHHVADVVAVAAHGPREQAEGAALEHQAEERDADERARRTTAWRSRSP